MKRNLKILLVITALFEAVVVSGFAAEQDRLAATTRAALVAAVDPQRPIEDRRQAVFTLGRCANDGSKEALEFLIAHISLRLPMKVIKGDEDQLKETPCTYALSEFCRGKPEVPAAILASLDNEMPPRDLNQLAFVLKRTVGKKEALRLLEDHLSKQPKTPRKRNLQTIHQRLTGQPDAPAR